MGNRNKVTGRNLDTPASMESFHRSHAKILELLLDSKPLADIFHRIALLIENYSPVKAWCVIALAEDTDLTIVAAPNIQKG